MHIYVYGFICVYILHIPDYEIYITAKVITNFKFAKVFRCDLALSTHIYFR